MVLQLSEHRLRRRSTRPPFRVRLALVVPAVPFVVVWLAARVHVRRHVRIDRLLDVRAVHDVLPRLRRTQYGDRPPAGLASRRGLRPRICAAKRARGFRHQGGVGDHLSVRRVAFTRRRSGIRWRP